MTSSKSVFIFKNNSRRQNPQTTPKQQQKTTSEYDYEYHNRRPQTNTRHKHRGRDTKHLQARVSYNTV